MKKSEFYYDFYFLGMFMRRFLSKKTALKFYKEHRVETNQDWSFRVIKRKKLCTN